MSCRYSSCLSFSSPNIRSEQHLGEADDGVERRPQLVGHVGEELRLVTGWRPRAARSSPRSPGTAGRSRMAMTAWSAKVWSSSISLSENGSAARRATAITPIASAPRAASAPGGGSGSPPAARARASPAKPAGSVSMSGTWVTARSRSVRAAYEGRRPARGRVPPHGGSPLREVGLGDTMEGRPDLHRRRSRGHRRGARTGAQWCRTRAAYRWASSKWRRAGSPPSPSAARSVSGGSLRARLDLCSRLAWDSCSRAAMLLNCSARAWELVARAHLDALGRGRRGASRARRLPAGRGWA